MTVVAFSRARFTPVDIAEWSAVAQPKLERGLWESVVRSSGPDFDRLVVHFPNLDRPIFRFERDARGRYKLLFNDRRGWYEIGSGDSAGECLSVWRGRPAEQTRATADAGLAG